MKMGDEAMDSHSHGHLIWEWTCLGPHCHCSPLPQWSPATLPQQVIKVLYGVLGVRIFRILKRRKTLTNFCGVFIFAKFLRKTFWDT